METMELSTSIFRDLKLELLTQVPASNNEKYFHYNKDTSSKFNYLIKVVVHSKLRS